MTSPAVVTGVADGRVDVLLRPAAGCRGCHGVCLWRAQSARSKATFPTRLAFRPGDCVVVALEPRYVVYGSLLVHGLPWVALLGGALLGAAAFGAAAGSADAGALAGAATALCTAWLATPRLRHRLECSVLEHVQVRPDPAQARDASTHSL